MRAEIRKMNRALWQQDVRELFDQYRIDHRGRDSRVAEHVLLDPRRVDDVSVKIDKRFAIRKVERRVGVNLTPDEHVFGGERDLLVAFANIGAHGFHDLLFWKIDLRIQIRKTELAAATAAGGHLDHTKRRTLIGEDDAFARSR